MDAGVGFIVVDIPHANKLTLHILAAVAEHEREAISEPSRRSKAHGQSPQGADVCGQRPKQMNEKLPAPCEACRGSGLRHGAVCSECQGKGYRLIVNGRQTPVRAQLGRRRVRKAAIRRLLSTEAGTRCDCQTCPIFQTACPLQYLV
jgi:hypothetical protein